MIYTSFNYFKYLLFISILQYKSEYCLCEMYILIELVLLKLLCTTGNNPCDQLLKTISNVQACFTGALIINKLKKL